jgi:hypothetical protein
MICAAARTQLPKSTPNLCVYGAAILIKNIDVLRFDCNCD